MLLDIISKMNYVDYVDPEKIIYFASSDKDLRVLKWNFYLALLRKFNLIQAMKLTYSVVGKATLNKPFVQPTATVDYITLKDSYKNELVKFNRIGSTPAEDQFTILMSPKNSKI